MPIILNSFSMILRNNTNKMIRKIIKKMKNKISIKKFFFPNMPNHATMNEWNEWHDKSRDRNPFIYFLSFDLPAFFRRNVYYKINGLYSNFRLKYIRTFNQIKIKTLKYDYYDIDTRLLHGMFALLLEFVENEKSVMYEYSIENTAEAKKELKKLSNLERGVKYLEWETTLDQNPNSYDYSPEQARAAKEILFLLQFWLNRKDMQHNRVLLVDSVRLNMIGNILPSNLQKINDIQNNYEEKLDIEEEEMLIRLIKIRKHLWT